MKNSSATNYGTLYIIATPIGNLQDLSPRAIETLNSVDSILAEDTRHSLPLLRYFGIERPISPLHEHNESLRSGAVIQSLKEGKNIALISDAGTPLISDPGFFLVRLAHQEQIEVVPIPGACAFITALCASGLPSEQFTFMGFLPAKSSARRAKLSTLVHYPHTFIFYESTHRILSCIEDIMLIFGEDASMVLAKELTKSFEKILSGPVSIIQQWLLEDHQRCKGEFVLLFPPQALENHQAQDEKLLNILLEELPLKQAVKIASALSTTPKNELYQQALMVKNQLKTK